MWGARVDGRIMARARTSGSWTTRPWAGCTCTCIRTSSVAGSAAPSPTPSRSTRARSVAPSSSPTRSPPTAPASGSFRRRRRLGARRQPRGALPARARLATRADRAGEPVRPARRTRTTSPAAAPKPNVMRATTTASISGPARRPSAGSQTRPLLNTRMSTDAPTAGLEEPEDPWDADRVREYDALHDGGPPTLLTAAAEHVATGTLAAFTQLAVPDRRHERPVIAGGHARAARAPRTPARDAAEGRESAVPGARWRPATRAC